MKAGPPTLPDPIALERAFGLAMALNTPKGRAVVATQDIAARSIVEISAVLVMPLHDLNALESTLLNHYTYNWPIKNPETGVVFQTQAVALGLGSLFNHSSLQQNVGWSRDLTGQCIVYKALRDIRAGEELCINYGKLWFVDADEEQRQRQDNDNDDFLSSIEIFD